MYRHSTLSAPGGEGSPLFDISGREPSPPSIVISHGVGPLAVSPFPACGQRSSGTPAQYFGMLHQPQATRPIQVQQLSTNDDARMYRLLLHHHTILTALGDVGHPPGGGDVGVGYSAYRAPSGEPHNTSYSSPL